MFDRYFEKHGKVVGRVRETLEPAFTAMADRTVEALSSGRKIYFFGNGGSAADAQHLATELVDRLQIARDPIPALALTTNTSLITAVSNDKEFAGIFSRQVEAYAMEGDVLIGISTSGASENILKAFRAGRRKGTVNVGFSGAAGWKEPALVDFPLPVPSNDTQLIQEMHIALGHLLCHVFEERLFAS